jgi:predicted metal-dependent RNase
MNCSRGGYPSMPTTYTIDCLQIRSIIARALKCDESEVQFTDMDVQGPEVTITCDDPHAPGRTADMFKRWAKADAKEAAPPAATTSPTVN